MRVVGRQHQIGGALPILQLEGRQLVGLGFLLGLLLVLPLLADEANQLLFLFAQELLAVGEARLGPLRADVGELRDERARAGCTGTMKRLPSRT